MYIIFFIICSHLAISYNISSSLCSAYRNRCRACFGADPGELIHDPNSQRIRFDRAHETNNAFYDLHRVSMPFSLQMVVHLVQFFVSHLFLK